MLCIGLHALDHLIRAVRPPHIIDRLFINRKIGYRTAEFRRHIRNRSTVGNGQVIKSVPEHFPKFSHDSILP